MKRMVPFFIFFGLVVFGVFGYLSASLGATLEQKVVLGILTLLVFFFPFMKGMGGAFAFAQYLSMGFFSFLFVFTVTKDLIYLATSFFSTDLSLKFLESLGIYQIFTVSGILSLVSLFKALSGPKLREISVPIKNLPQSLNGFKIAQMSDLHIGPTVRASYVQKVVDLVKKAAPDIAVLTGDIFDGPKEKLLKEAAPLAQLIPQNRVYFCSGNHEYYSNFAAWEPEISKLGIQILKNQNRTFDFKGHKVCVAGVNDPAATYFEGEGPNPKKALQGGEDSHLKILLSHRPGVVEEASKVGFDLQLSGHTHGGQFFPWTLVVRFVHRYFLGLSLHDQKTWVYVSPGTGWWGPPMRMGTQSEVTILTLRLDTP